MPPRVAESVTMARGPKSISENDDDWTICPECGCMLKSANLKRHISKVHERANVSEARKVWALCSECGCKLKHENLRRHLWKVHKKGDPPKHTSRKPSKPKIKTVQCEGCFRWIREDEIMDHKLSCDRFRALQKKTNFQDERDGSSANRSGRRKRARPKKCYFCGRPVMSGSDVCYECSRE